MRAHIRTLFVGSAAALLCLSLATSALAQVGRIGGEVKDDTGKPVKDAQITAENPNAVPSKFSATTDDRGRFSMAGMKYGRWVVTVQANGYVPTQTTSQLDSLGRNPPLNIKLVKGAGGNAGTPGGAEIQKELAVADAMVNAKQYPEAIAAYQAIMTKVPQLTVINLSVANVYRLQKQYDNAIGAYKLVLAGDANNERAKIGIGMTNLEKGDLAAAETTLMEAATGTAASKEIFYNLGEVKFAKGESDAAAEWYQKAATADPAWGKPLFKLGLVALNKGDKAGATAMMEKVIAADPASAEAAQAKMVIEQLAKS